MILYLEYANGTRKSWTIRSFSDLNAIALLFPQVNDIARVSNDLDDAVTETANYLSSHSMDSWVEEDGAFQKSVRQALTGIGMAAAMTLAPTTAAAAPHHAPVHTQAPTQLGTEPEDAFLGNIMQLESSGGKNTKHQPVESGKLKGQRALGRWGLLKPTIDEVIGRMEQAGTITPDIQKIKGMGRDGVANYFTKNPQTELQLARYLARHVLTRHHHDARRAAYSWKHGHNLFPADVTERDLAKDPYVKDFAALSHGDKVRGLTGSKMFVKKSEKQGDFRTRLSSWKRGREEMSLQDNVQFPERNRGIDPGRRIDPSEEIDIRTKTGNPKKDLANAIEDAKRARIRP